MWSYTLLANSPCRGTWPMATHSLVIKDMIFDQELILRIQRTRYFYSDYVADTILQLFQILNQSSVHLY